ncbi:MAG: hypothetical protein AAF989_01035, partial [Planctomycetota bacterium]
ETKYYQRQYTVARPVIETQMREQQYTVQRPVVETQMRTQQYTSMRPVTTTQNQTVDAGGYVAQQTVMPGQLQYGVGWNRAAYAVPGPLGIFSINRGAPTLVPQVTPPTVQTQYAYRPNYITQQVQRTTYVPEVQQIQTPVQVQRMQTEVVRQQVPVQVQRMQTEVMTENVPVQTTSMVPTTLVRKVPYTVQRPVTETLTRRVPVRTSRWVREEKVRKVPVRQTRMTYETKREVINVPYYEQQAVQQKVLKPVTRQEYVPYTVMVNRPQQVVQRTPLSYIDPFSPVISQGYSSFSSSIPVETSSVYSSPIVSDRPVVGGDATVTQPADDEVKMLSPADPRDEPAETELQSIQRQLDQQDAGYDEGDAQGVDDDDLQMLPAPAINGPSEDSDDDLIDPRSGIIPSRVRNTLNPVVPREARHWGAVDDDVCMALRCG